MGMSQGGVLVRSEAGEGETSITQGLAPLAVHSVGGVVTSAQPRMVVPEGAGLSAEVSIANLDIGFVQAGQDQKKGSFYPATLRLGQQDMLIDGRRVRLSPGMNITAEIKTGQRRIIEYLLSPVQRAAGEALRER